jgi:hypothetical protein
MQSRPPEGFGFQPSASSPQWTEWTEWTTPRSSDADPRSDSAAAGGGGRESNLLTVSKRRLPRAW